MIDEPLYDPFHNGYRTHAGLAGRTPDPGSGSGRRRANVGAHRWQVHCRGLYRTPIIRASPAFCATSRHTTDR